MAEGTALSRLHAVLDGLARPLGSSAGEVCIAVSGGVDSMTLAVVAVRRLGSRTGVLHAVSPAVPPAATVRVRDYADREGWRLREIDAGEFDDPRYRANPVNRCFFCKGHLYGAIARTGPDVILSGTNTDDLGDFRPGLDAAREHAVRHPFVEAGLSKAEVREIARELDLADLAALPASPCLSSRIETGIDIDPAHLTFVDEVERGIRLDFGPRTVRCRVRREAIVIELDGGFLAELATDDARSIERLARAAGRVVGLEFPVRLEPYRMGSAFVATPAGS